LLLPAFGKWQSHWDELVKRGANNKQTGPLLRLSF